jgi:hypothetical protein
VADTDFAIFLVLMIAWFIGRVLLRSWIGARLKAGTMTPSTALFALIASFAVLPLLAIPSRQSPNEIAFLVAAASAIFLIGVVVARFAESRMKRP